MLAGAMAREPGHVSLELCSWAQNVYTHIFLLGPHVCRMKLRPKTVRLELKMLTIAAKIITNKHFTKKMFWCNSFCNNYKSITLQNKSLGLLSSKNGHASGSNITKKVFWWNYLCNNYKDYYKRKCSKEIYCNNLGQDGRSYEK